MKRLYMLAFPKHGMLQLIVIDVVGMKISLPDNF